MVFFLFLRLSDTVFFCIFQLQKLFIRFRYLVRIKKEAAVTLPVLLSWIWIRIRNSARKIAGSRSAKIDCGSTALASSETIEYNDNQSLNARHSLVPVGYKLHPQIMDQFQSAINQSKSSSFEGINFRQVPYRYHEPNNRRIIRSINKQS